MAGPTGIEWTEVTWNPVTGCDRVSPGCDNCYAPALANRLKAMGNRRYQNDGDPKTSGPGFGVTCHDDLVDLPRSWRKPRLVFVNSMSDLFHPDVPNGFIAPVFDTMKATEQHTFQILTKQPQRLAAMAELLPWPNNIWMGVSVEDASYRFRIDHLRRVPANQCVDAGVAFFFKQWGGRFPKAGGGAWAGGRVLGRDADRGGDRGERVMAGQPRENTPGRPGADAAAEIGPVFEPETLRNPPDVMLPASAGGSRTIR